MILTILTITMLILDNNKYSPDHMPICALIIEIGDHHQNR
jgi:hypothetical protein